jgi:hypothetical protein
MRCSMIEVNLYVPEGTGVFLLGLLIFLFVKSFL